MKHFLFLAFLLLSTSVIKSQTVQLSGDFKTINIGNNATGDYSKTLILLHEIYNGTTKLNNNYAVGTIDARRGSTSSFNRFNVVNINTSSSYDGITGAIHCYDDNVYNNNNMAWKLKTCLYNGKKYIAVEVPIGDGYHILGYRFVGSTSSTGENMKAVTYEIAGQPFNSSVISNIQDFTANMVSTFEVGKLNITGNVGIGTNDTKGNKLAVAGSVIATSIKVQLQGAWPDYVFKEDYPLLPISKVKSFIKLNHHLPDTPSESQIEVNGINVGEMNKILMKKIEELTLYLIQKDEQLTKQERTLKIQEERLKKIEQVLLK